MVLLSMRLNNKNGFTLLEVVVVLVVGGIMVAVAVPNFLSWLPDIRLKGAARDFYSDMQRTRMEAVKTNRNTAIIFDTANNQYTICDEWNSLGAPAVCVGEQRVTRLSDSGFGVGYGHGEATATAKVSGGAFPTGLAGNVSYTNNVVVFNTQGFGTAGYVYIAHQDNTTTYAISSQTSGVIELKRWLGGADLWQ